MAGVNQRWLSLCARILHTNRIDPDRSLVGNGGTSLAATHLAAAAHAELGWSPSVTRLLSDAPLTSFSDTESPALRLPEPDASSPDRWPATAAQQWLLSRNRRSFVGAIADIEGPVSRSLLEHAVNTVLAVFDAFGLRFASVDDVWYASHGAAPTLQWHHVDDIALALRDHEQQYRTDPIPHASAAVFTTGTHATLWVEADHVLLDGHSADLFFTAVAETYAWGRYPGPRPPSSSMLARLLASCRDEATEAYWREVYERVGAYPSVDFPGRLHRSESGPIPAHTRTRMLCRNDLEAVLRGCRLSGVTPFTALLGCLVSALARLGVEQRIGVMTASAGRFVSPAVGAIGNFAHELVVDLGPSSTGVTTAVGNTRTAVQAARQHDVVHRADLLAAYGPREVRNPFVLWVTADAARAETDLPLGQFGRLTNIRSTVARGARTRSYPGLHLNVDVATPMLSCEYGEGDVTENSVTALLETWVQAMKEFS